MIRISSIAAMAQNHIIGKDGTMPWHLSEDLKHFKRTTMGKPILMGRKSYESLGKPLPGRANIVISRSYKNLSNEQTPHFNTMEAANVKVEPKTETGPFLYASIDDGIEAAKKIAQRDGFDEIFITGGGEIYKQTLPQTDRLYLTIIHKDIQGDTSFPDFDWNDWTITNEEKHKNEELSYTFFTLDRKA